MADAGGTKRRGAGEQDERITAGLIDAVNHPLRRRVLRALHDADQAQSPNRLAATLGEGLSNISYHMKVLAKRQAVKKTRSRQVRGAHENFFISKVAGNERVLAVLADTEGEDSERGGSEPDSTNQKPLS